MADPSKPTTKAIGYYAATRQNRSQHLRAVIDRYDQTRNSAHPNCPLYGKAINDNMLRECVSGGRSDSKVPLVGTASNDKPIDRHEHKLADNDEALRERVSDQWLLGDSGIV